MACYIYLHPDQSPDQSPPLYKIGKANDVTKRLKKLTTSYANDIKEKWYIYPDIPLEYTSGMLFFIERTLHKFLKHIRYREDREFFMISDINETLNKIMEHLAWLGIPVKLTRHVEDLKPVIPAYETPECDTDLRRYSTFDLPMPKLSQIPILENLYAWHTSNQTAGKLILPPGIGKSYITAFYIKKFNIKKVLVLVPLRVIQKNFTDALIRCGVDMRDINVTVYNTQRGYRDTTMYDLIVYDEAHHMCADENKKLLSMRGTKKLYLTATERIIDGANSFDMRENIFGPCIHRMTILQAVEQRLLCDYKIYLADWIHGLIDMIDQLHTNYHRKKIIIFSNSVEQSKQRCEALRAAGYSSVHIDGTNTTNDRSVIIQQFESCPFSIICNVGVIGEGADIPCIDTVIFADDRSSGIGVIQNIGRGLRVTPEKDFCLVIVSETMIEEKFLVNLMNHDERLSNPRGMIISSARSDITPLNPSYSLDGIVNIIERYNSALLTDTQRFVRKLQLKNIRSRKEYHEQFAQQYTDEFPKLPECVYNSFGWHMLHDIHPDQLTHKDEIRAAIDVVLADEKHATAIKKIKNTRDRITYIHAVDNRIPIELTKVCGVTTADEVHKIFRFYNRPLSIPLK